MSHLQIDPEREFYLRGPLMQGVPPDDSLLIRIDEKEFSSKLTEPFITAKLLGEIAAYQLTEDNPQEIIDTFEALSQLCESRQTTLDVWYLADGRGLYFALRYAPRRYQPTIA